MENAALKLENVINMLEAKHKFHICVHDISGFTQFSILNLTHNHRVHNAPFCDEVKKTSIGMQNCYKCKYYSIENCISEKKPFYGYCSLGIFDVVVPIIKDEKVIGIIFIGNIISDYDYFDKKLIKNSKRLGADYNRLKALAETTEQDFDLDLYIKTGLFLREYILMHYGNGDYVGNSHQNWLVESVLHHSQEYYTKNLNLKNVARLYNVSANYLGRIFKEKTGQSYADYINNLRIKKSAELLKNTKLSVLEISLSVGFENVTYYNRVFKKRIGTAPTKYRNSNWEIRY